MERHAKMWIDIAKIDQEKSVQMRESTDLELVTEYAQNIQAGAELPPVVVFRENVKNELPRYYLADGWHRLKAHEAIGKKQINVTIIDGGHRDAMLYAVGANAIHGRQRTRADKERAVLFLLNDPEWSKLSDQAILRHAKITENSFVRHVRDKYNLTKSKTNIQMRHGKPVVVHLGKTGRASIDYAEEFKKQPYNPKISSHITKAVSTLEKHVISRSQHFNKNEVLRVRKLIVQGLAEVENRLIASKIRARK